MPPGFAAVHHRWFAEPVGIDFERNIEAERSLHEITVQRIEFRRPFAEADQRHVRMGETGDETVFHHLDRLLDTAADQFRFRRGDVADPDQFSGTAGEVDGADQIVEAVFS